MNRRQGGVLLAMDAWVHKAFIENVPSIAIFLI